MRILSALLRFFGFRAIHCAIFCPPSQHTIVECVNAPAHVYRYRCASCGDEWVDYGLLG